MSNPSSLPSLGKYSKTFFAAIALKLSIIFAGVLNPGAAFSETDPGDVSASKYRIGVLAPLSGDFAHYGQTVRRAIESVSVPEIEWVFEDESCEPAAAVSAFKKLSTIDDISFFVGPCCGSPQQAVAPLLKGKHQLVLLPNAAPEEVFKSSGKRMYSAQYSLETEGRFLAEELNAQGLKQAAVVYVDTEFSRSIEAAFIKAFHGKIVYALHAPAFEASYMKAAALKLKSLKHDALIIPDASPLLLGLLTELDKIGAPRVPTYSVYSAQMPDVIISEKEHAEGLRYSYPDIPDTEDAFGYFPRSAAQLLAGAVLKCKGALECVEKSFSQDSRFKSDGTAQGGLVIKTVKGGKFVRSS